MPISTSFLEEGIPVYYLHPLLTGNVCAHTYLEHMFYWDDVYFIDISVGKSDSVLATHELPVIHQGSSQGLVYPIYKMRWLF